MEMVFAPVPLKSMEPDSSRIWALAAAGLYVVTVGVVHDLNLAARFADQIVLLNNGRVVANGTPAEVLTAERIQEVFEVVPTFVPSEHSGVHLIFN